MLDWIISQIDSTDWIIILIVAAATAYYFKSRAKPVADRYAPNIAPVNSSAPAKAKNLIDRIKQEERKVLIFYGSQTGTAEELAGRLAKDFLRYDQKSLVIDPEDFELEDLESFSSVDGLLLVFCMATYGEGDPTDNSADLYEHLKSSSTLRLDNTSFTVFGLGNKTYEHYNAVAKFFDKQLEEMGSERVYELGMGDDDGNLEEDFMRWREGFLHKMATKFGWTVNPEVEFMRQYRLELVESTPEKPIKTFHGEMGRLNAFTNVRVPFDPKNPFLANVLVNRELHSEDSDRNCRHIEFECHDGLRYDTGDHLGVFPHNDESLIKELVDLLKFNPDQIFKLIAVDEDAYKRIPFPVPTTYAEALRYYVDICGVVKSPVLKALAQLCSDPKEKEHLLTMVDASEESLKAYNAYMIKGRRNIINVLKEHPSVNIEIDYLLELLPRLQARYYSIASSPKLDRSKVAICAVVTRYTVEEREIKGVCTNYLLNKAEGSQVAIFTRKSTMRLPHKPDTPVIMIGPGTGFAPFRGFLQERIHIKYEKERELGEGLLYFGCRHPDHDYIYQEEIAEALDKGVLSNVYVAFSRAQEKKIYVQDLIWDSREQFYELIEKGAYIYVCGDARSMARDVQRTILRIFREVGGKSEEEAQSMLKDLEKKRRYQADVWS